MQRPMFAAARDVATSPSGCASRCNAVGENPRGKVTLEPRMVVEVSISGILTRTRGLIL